MLLHNVSGIAGDTSLIGYSHVRLANVGGGLFVSSCNCSQELSGDLQSNDV